MPATRCESRNLVLLAALLAAAPALAQTADVAPAVPPPPAPLFPPPDPAPPPPAGSDGVASQQQVPRTASEAFGSLGGVGAGPGGGIAALLSPTVGNMAFRASLGFTAYPSEPVSFQPTSLALYREDFSAAAPIWQNDRNEVSLTAGVRSEEFQTGAVLPNTLQPFPSQLIDVRAGTTYRHQFDNDWIAGVGGSFGSASNEPFHSVNELAGSVNAFLRVPQGDRNAWLFTVNYSSNSQINIPIPGVAYLWVPSDYFQSVIGFPFASVNYLPTDDLTLSLSYALLTTVHTRATYHPAPRLRFYGAFDWDNESFYLVPRDNDKDRFFYYEKRASAGVQYVLAKLATLDFSGGYAFDRFYFEGQSLSDRSFNRIDVGDGPYLAAKLMIRY